MLIFTLQSWLRLSRGEWQANYSEVWMSDYHGVVHGRMHSSSQSI